MRRRSRREGNVLASALFLADRLRVAAGGQQPLSDGKFSPSDGAIISDDKFAL